MKRAFTDALPNLVRNSLLNMAILFISFSLIFHQGSQDTASNSPEFDWTNELEYFNKVHYPLEVDWIHKTSAEKTSARTTNWPYAATCIAAETSKKKGGKILWIIESYHSNIVNKNNEL
jgi:hypothetical protein